MKDLADLKGTQGKYEGIEMSTNGLIDHDHVLIKPFSTEGDFGEEKFELIIYIDSISFEIRNLTGHWIRMEDLVPFLLKDKDFRLMVKIYQSMERDPFSVEIEDSIYKRFRELYYIHEAEEDTKLSISNKFLFEIDTKEKDEVFKINKCFIGDFVEVVSINKSWMTPPIMPSKVWYTQPYFMRVKTKPSKII